MKKCALLLFPLLPIFFFSSISIAHAEDGEAVKTKRLAVVKNKPFLIRGRLPHLTIYLMKQWDDPVLGLTAEQKKRLLEIRKRTVAEVKALAAKVTRLEEEVAKGAEAGRPIEELSKIVDEVARLKARATKVQLRCIYETKKVLTPGQLDRLLKTSGWQTSSAARE